MKKVASLVGAFALFAATHIFAAVVDVVEYGYAPWGHYFMTANPAEIAFLDGKLGWIRTGETFKVSDSAGSGLSPVCRFFATIFNPKSSHFYTPFASECEPLKAGVGPGWQYEGIAFYAQTPSASGSCPTGTQNVYRLYNNGQGGAPNHRYTTSTTIRSQMISQGWLPEGVGPNAVIFCTSNGSSGGDGSVAYQQTAVMVGGKWSFDYNFGQHYVDTFAFSRMQYSSTTPDLPWVAVGVNKYGDTVVAGYDIPNGLMGLLSPLWTAFDFFVYEYTTNDSVSGCYFFLPNINSTPTFCTHFAGRRGMAADDLMVITPEARSQQFVDAPFKEHVNPLTNEGILPARPEDLEILHNLLNARTMTMN